MSEKPRYERPSLQRHRSGAMNKMGSFPGLRSKGQIDGVAVGELVERYGSPVFVFSQRTLEDRIRTLRDAMRLRWPRVQLAWSYKTNYLDAICQIHHREGSWAEVVSGMEYERAMRNGVPTSQIVFNGPYKDDASLERALVGQSMVNLDHYDELAAAERIAERLGLRPKVGIRLNMSAGSTPRWSRFGFNLDSGQAWDAVRRLLGGGKLDLAGIHCHLGTFVLDLDAYREAAGKLAAFANRLRDELGVKLDWLDVGGGFASQSRLKSQYLPGEQATPPLSRYAEAVADGLRGLNTPPSEMPLLILETGRALVDDAGTLITTVVANKRLPDGRRAVVVDAGVNTLFTSFWYQHQIHPAVPLHGTPEPTVIYGPLCMNIDVVADSLLFPPVEVGTHLLVGPVGAYNIPQSMQFIFLRPPAVLISPRGEHGLIRRAEVLEDLVSLDRVPDWLRGE
ncbi:MAG: diaminopimelate decarboxylase [Deltaproteobacteria bacterium]|nr:diaminopimelate decarboxylase [Deltaproteobacteria bacterium]